MYSSYLTVCKKSLETKTPSLQNLHVTSLPDEQQIDMDLATKRAACNEEFRPSRVRPGRSMEDASPVWDKKNGGDSDSDDVAFVLVFVFFFLSLSLCVKYIIHISNFYIYI